MLQVTAACSGLLFALLLSCAYADERAPVRAVPESGESGGEEQATVVESTDPTDWRLGNLDRVEIGAYSTNYVSSLDDDYLLKSSVLTRNYKSRALSLVTFAELGKSRLFLGVNSEGLLGFHLIARPAPSRDAAVEFVRMPYLEVRDADVPDDDEATSRAFKK